MKLLENSSFEALGSQLCVETGESHILGRYLPLQALDQQYQ